MAQVKARLAEAGLTVYQTLCDREPTDSLIDGICAEIRPLDIDLIVSIGGGSTIDVGKAISTRIPPNLSVINHLQTLSTYPQTPYPKTPLIAIPTTSGSGNEVTPKIVINQGGVPGTKTIFSHSLFTPDAVILDPELSISCPSELTATCGLVTLAHLIEAEFSSSVSPLTEAIIWSGLEALKDNLLLACAVGAHSQAVRGKMVYAACISGLAQANTPLGVLQTLALTLSSICPIPYRIACSTLAGAAMRVKLRALRTRHTQSPILLKIAKVGELFDGRTKQSPNYYCDALVNIVEAWIQILPIPRLSKYGIRPEHLRSVVEKTLQCCSDTDLGRDEIHTILQERL